MSHIVRIRWTDRTRVMGTRRGWVWCIRRTVGTEVPVAEVGEGREEGGGDQVAVGQEGEDVHPLIEAQFGEQQHPGHEHLNQDHSGGRPEFIERGKARHGRRSTWWAEAGISFGGKLIASDGGAIHSESYRKRNKAVEQNGRRLATAYRKSSKGIQQLSVL